MMQAVGHFFMLIREWLDRVYSRINNTGFVKFVTKKIPQIGIMAVFLFLFLGLIITPYLFDFAFSKYFLVALIFLGFLFLTRANTYVLIAFLTPFLHSIPFNFTILVIALFIVIKNRFHLNLIQLIIPLFVFLYELIINFAYLPLVANANYGAVDAFLSVGKYAAVIFIAAYMIGDTTGSKPLKKMVYSFVIGLLLLCIMVFVIDIKYLLYAALPDNGIDPERWTFAYLFLNNNYRLSEVTRTISWLNNYANPILKPEHMIIIPEGRLGLGLNANPLGELLVFALFLLLLHLKKNWKSITFSAVIASFFVFFGIMTRSRAFLVNLLVIGIAYVIITILRNRLSTRDYVIGGLVAIVAIVVYIAVDPTFSIIQSIFYRFFAGEADGGDILNGRDEIMLGYFNFSFSDVRYLLFGTGMANYRSVVAQSGVAFAAVPNDPSMPEAIHFGPQQILVGYGLVGGLLFIAPFIYLAVCTYKATNQKNLSKVLPLGMTIWLSVSTQLLSPVSYFFRHIIGFLGLNEGQPVRIKNWKYLLFADLSDAPKIAIKAERQSLYTPGYQLATIDKLVRVGDQPLVTDKSILKEELANLKTHYRPQLVGKTQDSKELKRAYRYLRSRLKAEYHYFRYHEVAYAFQQRIMNHYRQMYKVDIPLAIGAQHLKLDACHDIYVSEKAIIKENTVLTAGAQILAPCQGGPVMVESAVQIEKQKHPERK